MRRYLYAGGAAVILGLYAFYLVGAKGKALVSQEIETPQIDVHELHKKTDTKSLPAQAFPAF